MLGPIGANLMSILRVLTPSEIDMYSEVHEDIVQPMAVGAEDIHYNEHASNPEEEYRRKLNKKSDDSDDSEQEDSEKAKIIPINKKVEQELSENGEFFEQKQSQKLEIPEDKRVLSSPGDISLNAIGILSKSQIQELEREKQRNENRKKDSTSVFILNQREQLKQSRMRLVEQKAIAQYQKNASAEIISKDVSVDDVEEEQMRDSCSKGILVNKKHY
jgi:hypothetical protein